jgi:para-nitrobenzyl esterase
MSETKQQTQSLLIKAAMNRRSFLRNISLAAGTVAAPAIFASKIRAQAGSASPIAKTAHGQVRGAVKEGVNVFKGIPYAGSPEGEGRFKPAPNLKPWTGVRDALLYGPQSMQAADPMWPKEWKPAVSSEDSLYLNIWTRGINDGKRRPVMFYSHGGGFATGNGGADVPPQDLAHDGLALARDYDVVVVTHNHRLNIFGYLYLGELLGEEYAASGDAGMLDIAMALEWVSENIGNFGGDPGNIMIWGESGGGAKTTTLTAMPRLKGRFHKASIESGSTLRLRTKESAAETARAILQVLGLQPGQARELLKVPAATLIEASQKLPRRPTGGGPGSVSSGIAGGLGFSPVVDGQILLSHPYDPVAPAVSANVPLITGTNKDETMFMIRPTPEILSMDLAALQSRLQPMFGGNTDKILSVYRKSRPNASPTELFYAITTAQWMGSNAITMAERKAEQKAAPVYMYVFAYAAPSPNGTYTGTAHAAEIPFKFNHVPGDPKTDAKARAARNFSRAWATFARTGNPSHDEIPEWPAYTLNRRATLYINSECKVVDDPYPEERSVWQSLV